MESSTTVKTVSELPAKTVIEELPHEVPSGTERKTDEIDPGLGGLFSLGVLGELLLPVLDVPRAPPEPSVDGPACFDESVEGGFPFMSEAPEHPMSASATAVNTATMGLVCEHLKQ